MAAILKWIGVDDFSNEVFEDAAAFLAEPTPFLDDEAALGMRGRFGFSGQYKKSELW